MSALLGHAEFWHWWVLATLLIILEMLAPGAFLLWLGLAAALVGAVLLAFPDMAWGQQLVLFAVLALAAFAGWWKWGRRVPVTPTDEPLLNRRGTQYIGRVFTLEEPIVNGFGKVRVDDTTWKIAGPDLATGMRVKVTSADGVILRVGVAEATAPAAT
ncbi:MAG: NfeD family protein [Alphaproteobacteria bacterium]|nr:NfeD family protein [Alphaproteobacteria bacterium]